VSKTGEKKKPANHRVKSNKMSMLRAAGDEESRPLGRFREKREGGTEKEKYWVDHGLKKRINIK